MKVLAWSAVASVLLLTTTASYAQPAIPVGNWQLQDAAKVLAEGQSVSAVGYKPVGWYPAVVPGTVLTTLVVNGVYPEPLYGENNRTIPESLCRTSYWYRTELTVPGSLNKGRRWLRFEGINYIANVWVNGRKVGDIKGAFTRGIFDVTDDLTPGKRAAIAVEILPPPHPGTPLEQTVRAGTGPNGGLLGADNPTFHATVGWDWIPGIRDRDMGLWQGVSLFTTGPVTVYNPYIQTDLPLPRVNSAELTADATLTNVSDKAQSGTLVGTYEGARGQFKVPVTLAPGETKTVSSVQVHVDTPRLWWPNGYGPQNLCKLHLKFVIGRSVSDTSDTTFGIHSISYFKPGEKTMTISVNGVPIMCKGGNWGMDEAMKRSPMKRLDAQLRLHHDANCTMIRNWIGMSTQEDFYEACDKYGILIWDDFWLANPADGPPPLHPDWFLQNAREKVVRFRNHPSIGVWCGRNEGNPPKVIDDGLAMLIHELDPVRFYQKHSAAGNGVGGGGPYSLRPYGTYFGPFRDSLHTEIGAPSIPTLEAVHRMMPEKDWWPLNDDWAEHDLCRGAQRGDQYPQMVADRFGPLTGLPDFVRKSQLVNYECYRAIFEGRNSKLFHNATGVLLWMSNPCQPSFVWQLYSYDLEPNGAEFGTEKACEPIHIQMNPNDGRIQVINNTPQPLAGVTANISIYDLKGKKIHTVGMPLTATPSAATDAMIAPAPDAQSGPVEFVKLELTDAKGKVLSENFYWRTTNGSVDFSALDTLPKAGLTASAERLAAGRTTKIAVTLRNPTQIVALMAHLQLRTSSTGDRVLPVFYSDNYVSLLPGESKRITIECATEDLKGQAPSLVLDGWNTVVEDGSGGGEVEVTTNEVAFRRR
jgi:beta-mannosidase